MSFWWPRQNREIIASTATPRKSKPLLAPQPNPQYQHNYGAGYSINYVPADWHTYRFQHILQLVPLPRRQACLRCSCGHASIGPARTSNLPFLFADLWNRHLATEKDIAATFDVLNNEIDEALKAAERELQKRHSKHNTNPSNTTNRYFD